MNLFGKFIGVNNNFIDFFLKFMNILLITNINIVNNINIIRLVE